MTTSQTSADEAVSATVTGYGISYAITSILSALLVILKESNENVHEFLVSITGHHWVTHGLLNVIIFVALGIALSRMGGGIRLTGNSLIVTVVGATLISGAIIAGYFI